jgi:hypothetical protein
MCVRNERRLAERLRPLVLRLLQLVEISVSDYLDLQCKSASLLVTASFMVTNTLLLYNAPSVLRVQYN